MILSVERESGEWLEIGQVKDIVLGEEEQAAPAPTSPKKQSRDAGSWIGQLPDRSIRAEPSKGTHNGKLDAAARERRAQKNARTRANRIARGESSRNHRS